MSNLRVLLIDDDTSITTTVAAYLEAKGYEVMVANDGADALELARTGQYPVIVSDIYIDRVTGLDVLREARARNPDVAVIIMTARGSVKTTVQAETEGAFEYLAKPFELRALADVIERARKSGRPQVAESAESQEELEQFGGMIGFSSGMVEVYRRIARFARSDDTVLIAGESGTGKELVANAIHENSGRAAKPFVPVDCGAIPGQLWESELFGVVRGAFTGADRDRSGVMEAARGGTVFLDEIGEIPVEFQPKLLRFLQEKEYRPVGSPLGKRADVRVIAATNRALEQMVADGEFREDLFHRLNVLRIDVPPLRERPGDIRFLVQRFLERATRQSGKRVWLEPEAGALIERHTWPGNVRELQNTLTRLVALNPPGPIQESDVRETLEVRRRGAEDEPTELEARERQQILKVLQQVGGNKTKAAEVLGIQRRTLYKKLARIEGENERHTDAPDGHGAGEEADSE